MKSNNKNFLLRLIVGMAGYALAVAAVVEFHPTLLAYRYLVGILPALPLTYIAFAIMRNISEKDEMMRRIMTETWAFSGIATGFTCASYSFLRLMGAPQLHPEWVLVILVIYAGIGLVISRRRYSSCECK